MYDEDFSELWLRRLGVTAAVAAGLFAAVIGSASMPFDLLDAWVRVAAFGTTTACAVTAYALARRSKGLGWAGAAAAALFVTLGYVAAS